MLTNRHKPTFSIPAILCDLAENKGFVNELFVAGFCQKIVFLSIALLGYNEYNYKNMNFLQRIKGPTLTLLIANIAMIILAIFEEWDFSIFIWVYWGESIIIGLFHILRILCLKENVPINFRVNGKRVATTKSVKSTLASMFATHYGLFHVVYFVFLTIMVGSDEIAVVIPLIGLYLLHHAFSFFLDAKHDRQIMPNVGDLFFRPYPRIVPMHIICIIGWLLSGDVILTVVFLSLKTITDFFFSLAHKEIIQ